jgi:hypothetical protein
MEDGTAELHAPVVTAPDDLCTVNEDRTDWNAALCKSTACLLDRGIQE